MRKHRHKIKAIKRALTTSAICVMTMLLTLTTFTTGVSANNDEVYFNDDQSVIILVDRNVNKDTNELELDFTVSHDENVTVDDIQIKGESIKNDNFLYSHAVGENDNYKFSVITTRIEQIENENQEMEEIVRKETFIFKVTVSELEETKEEIKNEPQVQVDNKVETDVSEEQIDPSDLVETDKNVNVNTIPQNSNNTGTEIVEEKEIIPDVNGKRVLDKIPSMEELDSILEKDEYVLVDNETGLITIEKFKQNDHIRVKRAADVVTTGRKVVPAGNTVTVTWRENTSYYWQLWGGISELFVNGNRAYCLEPSIMDAVATSGASGIALDSITGVKVHPDGRLAFTPTREQQRNVELIANYGYKYPNHQTDNYEWATKKLIWIEMGWDVSGGQNVDAEMTEIRSLISQHNDKPSWNRETRQVRIGEIVNLSESGINKFIVESYSGLEIVEDSGDNLKVRIIDKSASLTLEKKGGSEQGTSYVYSDGNSQKVAHLRIQDPGFAIIDFEVKSHEQRIRKLGENGEPLANHTFRMSYINKVDENGILSGDANNNVWDYVTGADGYTPYDSWNNEGQTVYVQEIDAKAPYLLNKEIKSFVVESGAETTMTFTNQKAQWQYSIFKQDEHGKGIVVTFDVYDDANNHTGTITTGADGKYTSAKLPLGSVTLIEKSAPAGIVLDKTPIKLTGTYKDQHTAVVLVSKNITNNYRDFDVTLTKVEDESDPFNPEYHGQVLEGVELGYYARTDIYEGETLRYRAGELIGKLVTNSVGQVQFHNLPAGDYRIKELATIEGYQLFDGYWDMSVQYTGTDATVSLVQVGKTLTNSPILGSVELVKANGTGSLRLEGAEFELYYKDKLLGTYTSDKDGRIVVDGLRYSTGNAYRFEEVKSPWGYWLNSDPIHFDITEQGEVKYLIAPNKLIEVHLEWNKANEDGLPLEGVGFKVRNVETQEFVTLVHADGKEIIEEDTWFTDAHGDVFIKGLITAGNYELVEVAPLAGYQTLAPVPFTVDDNQNYIDLGTLIGLSLDIGDLVNYWNVSDLKIAKVDDKTGEPLVGWGFNLYGIHNTLIGYYETGEDGTVTVKDLKYGMYRVKEIKVNGDYGIDPANNEQEIFIEEHGKTYTVTFKNTHADIKTSASFVERDKVEPNIVTITDKVSYTDLWIGKEYTVDGILMLKETGEPLLIDGKPVTGNTTFTPTEKDGFVNVDFTFDANNLQGQTVVVFETLKRDGIEVVVHADINDLEQTVEIPEIGTTVSFTERDKQEPNIVTLTDEVRYSGLVIGKEYTVNGTLMDGFTGEVLLIDGKEVTGTTTFTATQTSGSVNVTFTFDQNKLTTEKIVVFEELYEEERLIAVHANLEDLDQTIEIITYRILKKDIGTKEILKDAEFTRWDVDGNVVEIKTTDENGVVEFKLFKGEVNTSKETGAPEGYLLSEEIVTMDTTIHADGTLFEIEYFNTPKPFVELPPTGVDNTAFLFALPMMLLGIILVIVAIIKKRQTRNQMSFSSPSFTSSAKFYKSFVDSKASDENKYIKGTLHTGTKLKQNDGFKTCDDDNNDFNGTKLE